MVEVFISEVFEIDCPGCTEDGPFERGLDYCVVCENENSEHFKVYVEGSTEVELNVDDFRYDLD